MSRRAALKSIYGLAPLVCNESTITSITAASNAPALQQLLTNYIDLVDVTSRLIKKFFPTVTIGAGIIADMSAKIHMSPSLFVRLVWGKRNADTKFIMSSKIHLSQLKDIYFEFDMDWINDPVLKMVKWD